MDFDKIAFLFESLEKTSKRLSKIMILRDFYLNNLTIAPKVFDLIAGNYQRKIGKKTLGISIKTIIDVLHFLTKSDTKTLQNQFNQKGDIGEVAKDSLFVEKQTSLHSSKLTFENILKNFEKISIKTGSNSNKFKKELLGELFISARTQTEYKFLARILIDDLRIGVSQGIIKEAIVHSIFPYIEEIDVVCTNCNYISISSQYCFNCGEIIDMKQQNSLIEKKFQPHYCQTPYNTMKLDNFFSTRDSQEQLAYMMRNTKSHEFIVTDKPRELYNSFLKNFERHYNCINSFETIISKISNDLEQVLNVVIMLHQPVLSMLGTRANTIEDAFNSTGKPALFDYKYDGLRVQIHNENGDVTLFSRNLENITKQFPEIITYIKDNFSDCSFVLDTECVGYDIENQTFLPFQTLSRRILTKDVSSVSQISVVVKAFDILYLDGSTLINTKYEERRKMMEDLFIGRKFVQKKEIKSFIQQ